MSSEIPDDSATFGGDIDGLSPEALALTAADAERSLINLFLSTAMRPGTAEEKAKQFAEQARPALRVIKLAREKNGPSLGVEVTEEGREATLGIAATVRGHGKRPTVERGDDLICQQIIHALSRYGDDRQNTEGSNSALVDLFDKFAHSGSTMKDLELLTKHKDKWEEVSR